MSALLISGLKKSYRSPEGNIHQVIDVPDFALQEQEQMALLGTSGSGKTTLLNLIAGILQADSGNIFIGGENIAELSESERDLFRAKHIGYVFQTFNLLQGYTALENVLLAMSFAGKVDSDYAKKLLNRVGLVNRLHYKPRQLSVGQQQRVAIARALANNPNLILADEPTGNLDPENTREVIRLIKELCTENRATLLLVSHDPGVLQQFEHIRELGEIQKISGKEVSL